MAPGGAGGSAESVVAGQVREREGLRPGPLAGYPAAILVVRRSARLENPTRAEAVRRALAGIRGHLGVAPTRQRTATRGDE